MNATPQINQKGEARPFLPAPVDWSQLQPIQTLMGLSRRRLTRDEILQLIETRQIRWAWDIARPGARRPEVRIWRDSVLASLAGEDASHPVSAPEERSLTQVITSILPRPTSLARRAAAIGLQELQRRFLCCRSHLLGLIADGELSLVQGWREGIPPTVLYQSVFEFLKRRTMTA
jgi:hypothetical protein